MARYAKRKVWRYLKFPKNPYIRGQVGDSECRDGHDKSPVILFTPGHHGWLPSALFLYSHPQLLLYGFSTEQSTRGDWWSRVFFLKTRHEVNQPFFGYGLNEERWRGKGGDEDRRWKERWQKGMVGRGNDREGIQFSLSFSLGVRCLRLFSRSRWFPGEEIGSDCPLANGRETDEKELVWN